MIAGALEFTLGLEAQGFLQKLGAAKWAVEGFAVMGELAHKAFESAWQAIEQGSKLNELSKRAGVAASSMYELQAGFKAVGLSGEEAGGMINRLMRTMGEGETRGALYKLGLNPDQLKKDDPVALVQKITGALKGLDNSSQMQAGFALFGREGAQNIAQIARSGREFAEGVHAAAKDAEIWGAVAERFTAITRRIEEIKGHVKTMMAEITAALIAAWDKGQLGRLIFDTFADAIQAALALIPPALENLGIVMLKAFETPLMFLQTGMDMISGMWMDSFTAWGAAIGKLLQGDLKGFVQELVVKPFENGQEGFGEKFNKAFNERKASGVEFFGVGNTLDEMQGQAQQDMQAAMEQAGGRMDSIAKRWRDMALSLKPDENPDPTEEKKFGKSSGGGSSAWEKMGFIMGGGQNLALDYARKTADNTSELVKTIKSGLGLDNKPAALYNTIW